MSFREWKAFQITLYTLQRQVGHDEIQIHVVKIYFVLLPRRIDLKMISNHTIQLWMWLQLDYMWPSHYSKL